MQAVVKLLVGALQSFELEDWLPRWLVLKVPN